MRLITFVAEALNNFPTVAAISPSSRYLATAMLEPLSLAKARIVLELGGGTGAITLALLDQLPAHATLLVFEINPRFFDCLRQSISDPRVILINSSVENLDTELHRRGIRQVDAVTSSLGLAFMPDYKRRALFQRLSPFLHENSVFTQYQYVHSLQFAGGRLCRLNLRPLLNRYFGSVQSRIEWRNLPPAFVFTCHAQTLHNQ
jgi:phospholipid N-methyltransferase